MVINGVLYYGAACQCEDQIAIIEEGTTVEISNEADLKTVLSAGYSIKLKADVDLTSVIKLENGQKVTIDLAGKTITADWKDENGVVDVLWACGEGIEVTITGNGTMACGKDGDTVCVISATDGAKITIENGTFTSGGSACIYATRTGEITILDGTFSAEVWENNRYLLDVNEAETLGTIIVKGGSFKDFDPANHTNDGAYTNKVANGYHSIKDGDNYVVNKCTEGEENQENVVSATCTKEGSYNLVVRCTECNAILSSEAKTIQKAEHTFTNYVSDNNATCTADGTKTATCDNCNATDTKTDEGSMLDHSFTNYVSNNDATCTADGTKTAKCDNCNATDTITDEGSMLDHSYTKWANDESNHWNVCSVCGVKDDTSVEEHDFDNACDTTCNACEHEREITHSYTKWANDEFGHWNVCSVCGVKDDASEGLHSYDIWKNNDTLHWKECVCGLKDNESEQTHEFGWKSDATYHWTGCGTCGLRKEETVAKHSYQETVEAPTCTEGGYTLYVCACNSQYTDNQIAALGHDYENGDCKNCDNTVTLVAVGVGPITINGQALPELNNVGNYTFVGWSEAQITQAKDEPTILEAGSKYTGEATVLYAVYTFTETTSGASQFEKVTSAPSDWSGEYLIVYEGENGKVVFNGSLQKLDAGHNNITVDIDGNVIDATNETLAMIFTIASMSEGYSIKSASGFYIGNTSYANALKTSDSEYANTISWESDGSVTISSADTTLRFNNAAGDNNYRFRYYKSGQQAISLYKLVTTVGESVTYYITSTCEGHNYVETVVQPTCSADGYTNYKCSACSDTYTVAGAAKTGVHIDNEGNDYLCDHECGTIVAPAADSTLTIEQAIALGNVHTHNTFTEGKYKITGTIDSIASTTYGNMYIKDKNGNKIYIYGLYSADGETRYDAMETKPEVGDTITIYAVVGFHSNNPQAKNGWMIEHTPHEHNYGEGEVTTEATCTTDGVRTFTCSCGDSKTETIPATDHSYGEGVVTPPTCGTAGFTTFTCSECGDTYKEDGDPATGEHNYVDGTCSGCGATEDAPEVIFNVPDGVDTVVMGEGNVLPEAGAPDGYTFAGWSEVTIDETTDKPTILEAGSVYDGVATVLYAVYTRTETTAGTSQFIKVTSAPTDWSGQYLIVYEDESFVFDGTLTSDAANNYKTVTISNGVIEATDDLKTRMFTITSISGGYTIQSANGYYIGHTKNENKLYYNKTTKYVNTISLNSDETVDVINEGGSYLRFNTTSGQDRFRYYKSSTYTSQKAICLYKLVETPASTTTYYATLTSSN